MHTYTRADWWHGISVSNHKYTQPVQCARTSKNESHVALKGVTWWLRWIKTWSSRLIFHWTFLLLCNACVYKWHASMRCWNEYATRARWQLKRLLQKATSIPMACRTSKTSWDDGGTKCCRGNDAWLYMWNNTTNKYERSTFFEFWNWVAFVLRIFEAQYHRQTKWMTITPLLLLCRTNRNRFRAVEIMEWHTSHTIWTIHLYFAYLRAASCAITWFSVAHVGAHDAMLVWLTLFGHFWRMTGSKHPHLLIILFLSLSLLLYVSAVSAHYIINFQQFCYEMPKYDDNNYSHLTKANTAFSLQRFFCLNFCGNIVESGAGIKSNRHHSQMSTNQNNEWLDHCMLYCSCSKTAFWKRAHPLTMNCTLCILGAICWIALRNWWATRGGDVLCMRVKCENRAISPPHYRQKGRWMVDARKCEQAQIAQWQWKWKWNYRVDSIFVPFNSLPSAQCALYKSDIRSFE